MIDFVKVKDPSEFRSQRAVISAFAGGKIITTDEKKLALPLIRVAELAYALVMPRTFIKGQSAMGGSYGRFSTKPPKRGYWVAPGKPQPAGAVSDAWKNPPGGFKVYKSSAHYRALMGQRAKRYVLSGKAARSYQIKPLGPNRVRLQPVGGRGGRGAPTNLKVMRWQAKATGKSPIRPSPEEQRQLAELGMTLLTPELIESQYHAACAIGFRKKLRSRVNGLERLKRRERAARAKLAKIGAK